MGSEQYSLPSPNKGGAIFMNLNVSEDVGNGVYFIHIVCRDQYRFYIFIIFFHKKLVAMHKALVEKYEPSYRRGQVGESCVPTTLCCMSSGHHQRLVVCVVIVDGTSLSQFIQVPRKCLTTSL